MKGRPSGRTTMPLQNISQATVCVVIVPACGSHTAARKLVFDGSFPEPETTRTFPLCIKATCTGLMGMRYGKVLHCPCTLTCAIALGCAVAIKRRSNARQEMPHLGTQSFTDTSLSVQAVGRGDQINMNQQTGGVAIRVIN